MINLFRDEIRMGIAIVKKKKKSTRSDMVEIVLRYILLAKRMNVDVTCDVRITG